MAGTSRKKQDTDSTKKAANTKRSSTTGTNKTTGTNRTAGTTRKKTAASNAKAAGVNSFIGTEVAIIVSFAISVLLFLSNFGLCGAAGDICRKVLLGIFGSIGYVAPVLLFAGTCFYMSNRGNIRAVVKMTAVAVVLLALCGLSQMMFGGGVKEGFKLTQYYTQSGISGKGGGFVGGALSVALNGAIGTVGTYLVLLVALAIGLVCITEKSLVNLVKSGSGRAYEYAKEDMSRRLELHEERKEEKRRLREEQRVRGVDLGATNLTDVPHMMREFAAGVPEGTILSGEAEDLAVPEREAAVPERAAHPESVSEDFERPLSPADIFRGSISLPRGGEQTGEPDITAGRLSPAVTRELDFEAEDRASAGTGKPEGDSDSLLKQIYVRRDTRTFEEFSGEERESAPGYYPVHTETAKEPELPWRVDGEPEDFITEEDVPFEEDREFSAFSEDSSFPEEERQEDGYYKATQDSEGGLNYDSFFVPEEPKTVVTASGKMIETDTETVRKTLEKKRVESKSSSDGDVTVRREIEEKAKVQKVVKKEYKFPSLELLKKGTKTGNGFSEKEYRETAIKLQQTLQNFGVGVTVTNISCGPSVTRYELHPEQGVKVSKIVSLADDIKLNLAAADIRIEAPIPGKAAVGIEVPNKENNMVFLRDLLESDEFKRHTSRMAFAVGKDIAGQVVVTDIAKMPHLLIAGATGSGKSVCINTLIMSVIYKADPEDVKLIMIDPKVVELSVYNGIPHLLIPVVTEPKKASGALNWAVAEMEDRYKKFAKYNVRDLKGYNDKVKAIEDIEDENKPEKLPQIIIIVDELADLMMVAPGEVEESICRLAQLARAAGIHLVIATQRPSVNVITGLIKANIPSRIAFSVSSGVDSRTIIDMNGAEKLLGKGDMLFYPSGYQKPQRVQGAFVSDQEVSKVVEFLTEQGLTADYDSDVESRISTAAASEGPSGGSERDAYFVQAGRFIIEKDKASIGMLQRMFKIGFNRAARIMDQLAEAGVVGEEEGTKPRKILMTMEEFETIVNE